MIDQGSPAFAYTFHPFPAGTRAGETETFVNLSQGLGVNTHSSAAQQAAAQAFIDFVARPKQNALYAQIRGGVTQYQFLKGELPSFMSAMAPVIVQPRLRRQPGDAAGGTRTSGRRSSKVRSACSRARRRSTPS